MRQGDGGSDSNVSESDPPSPCLRSPVPLSHLTHQNYLFEEGILQNIAEYQYNLLL